MTSKQHVAAKQRQVQDEQILVVKRSDLFSGDNPDGFYQGVVRKNIAHYEKIIREHAQFLPRSLMEFDERYKQIIPYLVFTHNNRLFLMQRSPKASESRLANKYSLGIGGHVNESDIVNCDIAGWGEREFHEEIDYKGDIVSMTPIGILNDDSNSVGRVHAGIVYLLHGNSDEISVKSELQEGMLLSHEECEAFYDRMEPWSQLVFDTIKRARYI